MAHSSADADDGEIPLREETDTVEAQFGGEYSDATLDMVRGYSKPTWMEEPSSLDPIEDLEDHIEHGLRLPPKSYKAVLEAADEEVAEILASKDLRMDPEHQELVEYRKQLVDGTSLDDLKWLKLRTYHRAMDEIKAKLAEDQTPEARRALMEAYQVPLDKVPADLIDLTPEQLASRWREARSNGAGASSAPDFSEDSEWDRDWDSRSHLHCEASRRDLACAFAPPVRESEDETPEAFGGPWGEFGEVLMDGDPEDMQTWQPVHGFTPEYLQHQQMLKRMKAQQRQRAVAFWLPLAAVLGAYAAKGLKRMLLRRRRGQGEKKEPKVLRQ